MARFEMLDPQAGMLGQASMSADIFYELGMSCSTGRSMPADLVSAHKWFNIAAVRGNKDAVRLRREISLDMSEAQIATAQRAARDWLSHH